MTKKDYIALARAISTLPDSSRLGACAVVGMVLRIDNPLFDMERFAKACGVQPEPAPVSPQPTKWVWSRTRHLWWNRTLGWTSRENATVYTQQQREHAVTRGYTPTTVGGWEPAP